MKTNYEVALAFNEKKAAKNRNMSTNGEILNSYNLTIARWVNDYIEVLSAPTISNSTSRHFSELWSATSNSKNSHKKRYVTACVNHNYNLYNCYQLPKEGQSYVRIVSSKYSFEKSYMYSLFKDFESCGYHEYYGFENYILNVTHVISGDDLRYEILANFKYDSNKNFIIPEKKIINAEFKTCETCGGLGFMLNKNYRQKTCKDCSRGIKLCLT